MTAPHLQIFGRAARSGAKEMFPQADLKVAPQKGGTVEVIGGEDVQAKAIGTDTIDVAWRDKLKIAVQVTVGANTIADLHIDPSPEKTINTGGTLTYQVTGMRGGNRVVLTPADGLQLNVTNPMVASVVAGKTKVSALGAGQTEVIAQFAGQKARTTLNVTASAPEVTTVTTGIIPAGPVKALLFDPPSYKGTIQAIGQTAKLRRQYENGGYDDVSSDPNVKMTEPNSTVAKVEKVEGGWKVSPIAPGMTKITATLGALAVTMPIEVDVGDVKFIPGQFTGIPSTLTLWAGETQTIGNVTIVPGGQAPVPVDVTIKAPDGQGIVSAEGNKITGRSVGDVPVTVTAGGQMATVNVHVTAADSISINPPEINLQVGQSTPASVMAKSSDGQQVAVAAKIESMDKNVLDVDPAQPGQFVARAQGQTQIRAVYRGIEVFSKVSVLGQRFQSVKSSHHRIDPEHFDMTIEVLAAGSEGELEYQVYREGTAPTNKWVPNQPEGDLRKATFSSDPLNYNQGDTFHLVIEARDKKTNSVQKYPLTLVRSVTVEQQDQSKVSPQPAH